jgi:hypothetical protein
MRTQKPICPFPLNVGGAETRGSNNQGAAGDLKRRGAGFTGRDELNCAIIWANNPFQQFTLWKSPPTV